MREANILCTAKFQIFLKLRWFHLYLTTRRALLRAPTEQCPYVTHKRTRVLGGGECRGVLRYPGARGDQTGETPTHGTCSSTGLGRCSGRGCTAAPSEGQPGAAALVYLGTSSCREQPGDPRAIPASPPRVYLIPREISWSLMVQGGPMASRESSDSVVVHRAPCLRSWEKLSQRAKALISPAESHATPRNRDVTDRAAQLRAAKS